MQVYIMFNGIKTVQPDEDGYSANLSTTSTEISIHAATRAAT